MKMKNAAAVLIAVSFLLLFSSCASVTETDLYSRAMCDAVVAEPDEIRPLVEITKDSELVTWNEDGDKVLMLSWNRHPERYIRDSVYTVDDPIWTFTDQEIISWYRDNKDEVKDWILRLEELIGLPENSGYTHVTAFWCEEDEILRPAYETDITEQIEPSDLDGSSLGELEDWFNENILYSYIYSAYPWTRLGYTYDWKGDSDEYGLSEFIIIPGSSVEIEWTISTSEFLQWLEAND